MAILLLAAVAFCGCATKPATASRPAPAKPGFTIFLVGDSTMADKPLIPANPERGWDRCCRCISRMECGLKITR
jgi:hypothetical protein